MTTPTKGHPMKTRLLAISALTLTTALSSCGQDNATPAPTSSTPDQHIHGGNDPRYKQGVETWLAFSKTAPADVSQPLPSEAAKYATAKAISADEANRKLWATGGTTLGKVQKATLSTKVNDFQGMDIYLDTPTQPYEMTVRVCGTTTGEMKTSKGQQKINSTMPATLHFKSVDRGKTWKVDVVDVNAPSDIKLGCETSSPAASSATPPASSSKG